MKRQSTLFWGLFLLLFLATGCGKKIPVKGSAEWKRRLDAGETFIETQVVPGTNLKLGTAHGVLDAPVPVVWEIFQNAGEFSQFLYHVKDSKELRPENGQRMFELTIEPPTEGQMIFKDIHFKARVSQTINRDTDIWRGDYEAVEGNVKRVYGAWQLEPWGDNQCLIVFSAFNDFGYPSSIDFAVNFYTEQFLSRWSENLKERISDPQIRLDLEQRAASRAGRDPRDIAPVLRGLDDFIR